MKEVLFTTGNRHKIKEAKAFFEKLDWNLVTPEKVGIKEFPEEYGITFAQNATIKAEYGARESGMVTLAEDSGICIESLNNGPGIKSQRWADENSPNFLGKLWKEIGEKESNATMISVLSLISPDLKKWRIFSGFVEGKIVSPKGEAGFGYDSVFLPKGHKATFAEMTLDEKQKISHRARAFENMIESIN